MSDWCNLIMMSFIKKLYPAQASKMNAVDFYGAWKMFSSHTMSVPPESSWKLQAVMLQGFDGYSTGNVPSKYIMFV